MTKHEFERTTENFRKAVSATDADGLAAIQAAITSLEDLRRAGVDLAGFTQLAFIVCQAEAGAFGANPLQGGPLVLMKDPKQLNGWFEEFRKAADAKEVGAESSRRIRD